MTKSLIVRCAVGAAIAVSSSGVLIGTGSAPTSAAPATVLPFEVVGPAGSEEFGEHVLVLSNGNYVVVDERWDDGDIEDVGAVYLYDGVTNQLISRVTGTTADDRVGSGSAHEVGTSDVVVLSASWDGSGAVDAGAATWIDGRAGLSGTVTAGNSLVGGTEGDSIGLDGRVGLLTNGNFVLTNRSWQNSDGVDVGAVTWGDGEEGMVGPVNSANSLVGSLPGDLEFLAVTSLSNGHYVVEAEKWDDGAVVDVGAVTWGNGDTGTTGVISQANSFVGSAPDDGDRSRVTPLSNGSYVVARPHWDNGSTQDAGAATWSDGTSPLTGTGSAADSLVGSQSGDRVGDGLQELENGNYVVVSEFWSDGELTAAGAVTWGDAGEGVVGAVSSANSSVGVSGHALDDPDDDPDDGPGFLIDVQPLADGDYLIRRPLHRHDGSVATGAVTWADGNVGTTGEVSEENSLVGASTADQVGITRATELSNGNYVVSTPTWDNGPTPDAGAITWGDGASGTAGVVSASNSLVGSSTDDYALHPEFDDPGVFRVTALSTGDYVVASSGWDDVGTVDAGAITLLDGASASSGIVSAASSLIGSNSLDFNDHRVVDLGGDFVVAAPSWDDGGLANAGAVVWIDSDSGTSGMIDATVALVGSSAGDAVGDGLLALADGDYVVVSSSWDDGGVDDVGAVTWVDGSTGIVGPVTVANSLVGSSADDSLGISGVQELSGGNVIVASELWDAGLVENAGAVTWIDGATGLSGAVSEMNSMIGSATDDRVGKRAVVLADGNGLVGSRMWDRGGLADAGALTWIDGDVGVVGEVSETNSLVGSAADDSVGLMTRLQSFGDAGYAVANKLWGGGLGALTFGAADMALTGEVTAANSAIGSLPGELLSSAVEPENTVSAVGSVLFGTSQGRVLGLKVQPESGPGDGAMESLSPERVLDTRLGGETSDGAFAGIGQISAGEVIDIPVVGRVGVPSEGVSGVVVNVTAINPSGRGFVTVFGCGERPVTSSLNYSGGGTVVGNELVAKVSPDGSLCVFSSADTELTLDVAGFVPDETSVVSLDPARFLDTRIDGSSTVDGQSQGDGRVPAGEVIELSVAGRGNVPVEGASAVIVNVTVVNPSDRGFLTAFACGDQPLASSLNYSAAGVVAGNELIAKLSPGGSLCLVSSAETDLTADVAGYVESDPGLVSLDPARLLDTRQLATGDGTVDGVADGRGVMGSMRVVEVPVLGRGGVPGDGVSAIVMNVTALNPTSRGFVTSFPCSLRPTTSGLNYASAGAVVGNEVVAKVSVSGTVCLFTSASTHLIADVVAHLPD